MTGPKLVSPPPAHRSEAQIREQYGLERALARRLREADRDERPALYSRVYDELFQTLAHHPQVTRNDNRPALASQIRFLRPYLSTETRLLELGAGNGSLAKAIAPAIRAVFALEVSDEVIRRIPRQSNLEVIRACGPEIPLADDAVDLVYSYQVMEHLHPDDAFTQLREVVRVLAPGGAYLCITPNRLSGPHDISRFFDREATGLHLREYTVGELSELFYAAGFAHVSLQRVIRGRAVSLPAEPVAAFERLLEPMPWPLRTRLARADLVARGLEIFALGRTAKARNKSRCSSRDAPPPLAGSGETSPRL